MPTCRGAHLWCALLLPCFAAVLTWLLPVAARSAGQPLSSWLKAEPPVFKTIKATMPFNELPIYNNKDCSPHTSFITIPKNILKTQPEASYETCAAQTSYGQVSVSDGNVRLFDTSLAGSVKTSNGSSKLITPIPNSNHVMTFSGGLYGAYRYIIKDFDKNIETLVQPNGSIIHKLKLEAREIGVKNAAGELIDFAEPRFSDNGKWMIADAHLRGMHRVNIETGETLIFGPPYNYAVGTRPQFVSAISSDGRYALVAAYSYGIFKMYDLSTCILNTDRTRQANCQSKDLLALTTNRFSNFEGLHHAQFSTNYSLRLYIRYGGTQGYLTLTAAGETESRMEYLAIGDSFASGEGTFNYKADTDIRTPFNGCHLSLMSYPFLLAAKTNLNSVQSAACSGARMRDIVNANYTEELAQSKGKNNSNQDSQILANYLVGYRPQLNFVENNKPANLTVSIGGNDIGFSKILLACLAPGTCYTDSQERINLIHTINQQFGQLVSTYDNLRKAASTNARIYALGYPLLTNPGGKCALNVHLNQQETLFANQLVAYLNTVIKQAAQKAGVSYINIEHALAGHRLCETNSSRVAVNGLTAGNDKTFSLPIGSNYTVDGYFTGKESYHPNQLGHKLISEAIAAATNNFSTPAAEPAAVPDPTNLTGNGMTGAAEQPLSPRKIIFDDNLIQSVVTPGHSHQLHKSQLQPSTSATLRLNTQSKDAAPTFIGNYQATNIGQLDVNFSLPGTLKPGIYVVHLEVKNKAGEDVDIQKVIYVAYSQTDIDGDSIPNEQEECLLTEPSNIDIDRDTTDDACDPLISESPITVSTPHVSRLSLVASDESRPQPQPKVTNSALDSPSDNTLNVLRVVPGSGQALLPATTHSLGVLGSSGTTASPSGLNKDKINSTLVAATAIILTLSGLYLIRNKWQKLP